MKLSERIELIRNQANMSKAAFARHLGLPNPQIIQDLASGKTKSLSVDVRTKILSCFPEINTEWLLTGEGEMLKQAEEPAAVVNYTDGVPYYDEDFMLGFDELVAPSSENPAFLVRMPGYERATLWCNASGRSMEPEIDSGDIIALQRIDDFSFLPLGDIYGIITTNGMRTIKRIGRGSREGYLRLIPTNPAYDEQEIHLSQIAILYRVLGALKSF